MSAIAGIYYLDGQPVDRADLGRMVDTLAHRGPDDAAIWSEGCVGLGHRMLWTTPESLLEKLPLVDRRSDLVITADARIDNRDELIAKLSFCDRPAEKITDSQLILAAYEQWGKRCPEYLLGDFAFAIWDARQQQLFCARDHMGVKPCYYYYSGKLLVFASEIRALLCLREVPRLLNEARVADYLVQKNGYINSILEDSKMTLYQNLVPLPAAHWMMVNSNGIQIQNYWSLDPERELRLSSNEEYAEAFRELFTNAVKCRLRSAFPVGVMLSGGLDSSSVACTARQLLQETGASPLPTFSAIFPSLPAKELRFVDERHYLKAVLDRGGFDHHYIEADRLSPLRDLDRVYFHDDECFYAPNLYLTRNMYRAAQQKTIRVMLDGLDGDIVVSHGGLHLRELAQAGNWIGLAQQMRVAGIYSQSPWKLFSYYLWSYGLKPTLIRGPIRKAWQTMHHQFQPTISPIINANFAQRLHLAERVQAVESQRLKYSTVRGEHYQNLTAGIVQLALQLVGRTGATFAIEPRHPFFDRRLVEFCLALPTEQKLNHGWSRLVLRRAMTDILPATVQWRETKANLGSSFNRGFLTHERELLDQIVLGEPGILENFVDFVALREAYSRYKTARLRNDYTSPEVDRDACTIWVVVTLAMWLQEVGLMH
ncbi:MAG TPA: lasso peptide isopeptide bond-forming cyclase [Allocoleopsis sp.]